MEDKNKAKNAEHSIAPGIDDSEELEQLIRKLKSHRANIHDTVVIALSNDEVDQS
jgi:hypothetical protein